MDIVLEWINKPDDVCSLMLLIVVLAAIGSRMVRDRNDLRRWGHRISAAALVGYLIYAVRTFRPSTANECLGLVLRAILAAGAALGISQIQLAVFVFIYDRTMRPLQDWFHRWRQNARRRTAEWEAEQRRIAEIKAKQAAEEEAARLRVQVPSRTESVRQAVAQAKQDYEVDCETIRSLGLRTDEKRAALLEAKQKLLRRLSEALQ
jgi:hypothetical protein